MEEGAAEQNLLRGGALTDSIDDYVIVPSDHSPQSSSGLRRARVASFAEGGLVSENRTAFQGIGLGWEVSYVVKNSDTIASSPHVGWGGRPNDEQKRRVPHFLENFVKNMFPSPLPKPPSVSLRITPLPDGGSRGNLCYRAVQHLFDGGKVILDGPFGSGKSGILFSLLYTFFYEQFDEHAPFPFLVEAKDLAMASPSTSLDGIIYGCIEAIEDSKTREFLLHKLLLKKIWVFVDNLADHRHGPYLTKCVQMISECTQQNKLLTYVGECGDFGPDFQTYTICDLDEQDIITLEFDVFEKEYVLMERFHSLIKEPIYYGITNNISLLSVLAEEFLAHHRGERKGETMMHAVKKGLSLLAHSPSPRPYTQRLRFFEHLNEEEGFFDWDKHEGHDFTAFTKLIRYSIRECLIAIRFQAAIQALCRFRKANRDERTLGHLLKDLNGNWATMLCLAGMLTKDEFAQISRWLLSTSVPARFRLALHMLKLRVAWCCETDTQIFLEIVEPLLLHPLWYIRKTVHEQISDIVSSQPKLKEALLSYILDNVAAKNKQLSVSTKLVGTEWYGTYILVEALDIYAANDEALASKLRGRCSVLLHELQGKTNDYVKLYAGKTLVACTYNRAGFRDLVKPMLEQWMQQPEMMFRYWALKILLDMKSSFQREAAAMLDAIRPTLAPQLSQEELNYVKDEFSVSLPFENEPYEGVAKYLVDWITERHRTVEIMFERSSTIDRALLEALRAWWELKRFLAPGKLDGILELYSPSRRVLKELVSYLHFLCNKLQQADSVGPVQNRKEFDQVHLCWEIICVAQILQQSVPETLNVLEPKFYHNYETVINRLHDIFCDYVGEKWLIKVRRMLIAFVVLYETDIRRSSGTHKVSGVSQGQHLINLCTALQYDDWQLSGHLKMQVARTLCLMNVKEHWKKKMYIFDRLKQIFTKEDAACSWALLTGDVCNLIPISNDGTFEDPGEGWYLYNSRTSTLFIDKNTPARNTLIRSSDEAKQIIDRIPNISSGVSVYYGLLFDYFQHRPDNFVSLSKTAAALNTMESDFLCSKFHKPANFDAEDQKALSQFVLGGPIEKKLQHLLSESSPEYYYDLHRQVLNTYYYRRESGNNPFSALIEHWDKIVISPHCPVELSTFDLVTRTTAVCRANHGSFSIKNVSKAPITFKLIVPWEKEAGFSFRSKNLVESNVAKGQEYVVKFRVVIISAGICICKPVILQLNGNDGPRILLRLWAVSSRRIRPIPHLSADQFSNAISLSKRGSVILKKGNLGDLEVAIKAYKEINAQTLEQFNNEIEIMSLLSVCHQCVELKGIYVTRHLHIVSEFIPLTLLELMKQEQISPTRCQRLVHDLAKGVAFLHLKDILHRDLRSQNVLVMKTSESDWQLKISEFGSACYVGAKSSPVFQSQKFNWLAPELLQPTPAYGKKSDIWACGVIVWELITSVVTGCYSTPYGNVQQNQVQLLTARIARNMPITALQLPTLPIHPIWATLEEVTIRCLKFSPEHRPTAQEIFANTDQHGKTPAKPKSTDSQTDRHSHEKEKEKGC